MVLNELVNASLGCFYFETYHASFLLALCAADATAKKRFPHGNSDQRQGFLGPTQANFQSYWTQDRPS